MSDAADGDTGSATALGLAAPNTGTSAPPAESTPELVQPAAPATDQPEPAALETGFAELGADDESDITDPEPAAPAPLHPRRFDPANLGEFDPGVCFLHLERDGVIVQGQIDPFTGEGCRYLLHKLKDELVKARAKEDGAAPPAPLQVGVPSDPNALAKLRAQAAGHQLNDNTGHCDNCQAANWWALDGNPCLPPAPAAPRPSPEENTNGQTDDIGAEAPSA